MSSISEPAARAGGCLCGAVRYLVDQPLADVAICHCSHCRKQSGALFSANIVVTEDHYRQTGEVKVFEDRGDSGEVVFRHFCPNCGSPILSRISALPSAVIIKSGTLDDLSGLAPVVEVYTDRAVSWGPHGLADLRFPEAAP
ncbi:MAG: GFA family protein [Brevundimonas sp.]